MIETHDHGADEMGRLFSKSVIFLVIAAVLRGTLITNGSNMRSPLFRFLTVQSFSALIRNYKGGQKNIYQRIGEIKSVPNETNDISFSHS